MTDKQVVEAIEQMKSHCKHLEENDYHSVSARGVLYTLGYASDEADIVIRTLADHGFHHCVDPMIPIHPNTNQEEYPSEYGCYWGPDQLRSRLDCLRSM